MTWLNVLLDGLNAILWLGTAQGINALLALTCVLAAMGASPRVILWLTALLHVVLMGL